MRAARPVLFCLALTTALLVVSTRDNGRAQTVAPFDIVTGVGLPGIDDGKVVDESRVPGSPEAARRHRFDANTVVRERLDSGH